MRALDDPTHRHSLGGVIGQHIALLAPERARSLTFMCTFAALASGLGAEHRVWDDASHALPIQHPAAVNGALRAHFASAV